jgi:hypothetical protein
MNVFSAKHFILHPYKDGPVGHAARMAILAFAEAIKESDPSYAFKLCSIVDDIIKERAEMGKGK